MKSYFVWVTAMVREYEDLIISGLVKKGYTVGPASKDHIPTSGTAGYASFVIALKVEPSETDTDASKVHEVVCNVLKEKKLLYYSVLVSTPADCCWRAGNIQLPEPSPSPSVPGAKKSDMN